MISIAVLVLQLTAIVFFADWLSKRPGWLSDHLKEVESTRFQEIDGLRGILATGVFLHHAYINYGITQGRNWTMPFDSVFAFIGPGSVLFFFYVTAFLFWNKAIRGNGNVPLIPLLVNRLKRIAPLYLLHVALLIVGVFAFTGWQLKGTPSDIYIQAVSVFSLGLIGWNELNGIEPHFINAGVTWSLSFEWIFYLALPIIAVFARWRWWSVALAAAPILTMALFFQHYYLDHMAAFGIGIGTAIALQTWPKLPELKTPSVSIMALAILLLCMFESREVFNWPIIVGCGAVFFAVAYGCDFWGFLNRPGVKLLGVISYSIYLMHGFVLCVIALPFRAFRFPQWIWFFVSVPIGCLVVLVSLLTYRFVELPFIRKKPKAV